VAAVRHPAGALAGPQTFPNSAQSAFGHAESFYVVIVDLPWPSTSSLPKPCKNGVDARNNSRIGSGDRHDGGRMVRRDRNVPYFLRLSVSAKPGEATSLLNATNLPKADMTNR
jgi:hypothetical protein